MKDSIDFKAYLNNIADEEVKKTTYQISKKLSNAIYEAISYFYDDYDPRYYHRVYGLKNLFRISTVKTPTGKKLVFDFAADYITGVHNSPEDAFESSFVYGWHGGEYAWGHKKPHVERTLPSPWAKIIRYLNENYERMM